MSPFRLSSSLFSPPLPSRSPNFPIIQKRHNKSNPPKVVDLYPLYPPSNTIIYSALTSIREWYIDTYNDPFSTAETTPAFFVFFFSMEAVGHLPFSVWAVWGYGVKGWGGELIFNPLSVYVYVYMSRSLKCTWRSII